MSGPVITTAYCPSCREQVVPMDDGLCCWCDTQTGGAVRPQHSQEKRRVRPRCISEPLLQEARVLYASGLSFRQVAAELCQRKARAA